jgi:hypothetical protein
MAAPYKDRNKPESQQAANRAHAKLRGPDERTNDQLKIWRILHKLRCRPGRPARQGDPPSARTRDQRMKAPVRPLRRLPLTGTQSRS